MILSKISFQQTMADLERVEKMTGKRKFKQWKERFIENEISRFPDSFLQPRISSFEFPCFRFQIAFPVCYWKSNTWETKAISAAVALQGRFGLSRFLSLMKLKSRS